MFDLSIIIVTYNSANDIKACIDSIENTKEHLSIEIYVVDNASKDATVDMVRMLYPHVHVIANLSNQGFSTANNQAIEKAKGDFILLLNPDTVVMSGALQRMLDFMNQNKNCGVCGPRLLNADGTPAGDLHGPTFSYSLLSLLHIDRFFAKKMTAMNQDAVSGAAMLFRKSIVSEVGLLDPELFWCEDYDFCTRVRHYGKKVCIVSDAHIVHLIGQSVKSNYKVAIKASYVSRVRYARKYYTEFETFFITCTYILSAFLRTFKWCCVYVFGKDPTAKERATICFGVGISLLKNLYGKNV